jgi:osmotically-inducible protein OsmY
MKKLVMYLALIALWAATAWAGQTGIAANAGAPLNQPSAAATPAAASAASSAQVRTTILNAFEKDQGTAARDLAVRVTDAKVSVSGTVPTFKDKAVLRMLAEQNSGGRPVDVSALKVK